MFLLENLETRSWGEVKLFATQTWGLEFRPPEIQRNVRWAWRPVFLIPSLESRDKGFPRASYLARVAIASRSECHWESLPRWIRWKSHWGWFLPGSLGSTCTSTFVHMYPHTCSYTHARICLNTDTQMHTTNIKNGKRKFGNHKKAHPCRIS